VAQRDRTGISFRVIHFPPRLSLIEQINAVAAVNRNTIVVIHSVGPVSMEWASNKNIIGVFYAGAPGEQTGPSIVDVLWGSVNPSGRLSFSIDEVCNLEQAASGTVTDNFARRVRRPTVLRSSTRT
jgi:hypothetical protein